MSIISISIWMIVVVCWLAAAFINFLALHSLYKLINDHSNVYDSTTWMLTLYQIEFFISIFVTFLILLDGSKYILLLFTPYLVWLIYRKYKGEPETTDFGVDRGDTFFWMKLNGYIRFGVVTFFFFISLIIFLFVLFLDVYKYVMEILEAINTD